MITSPQPHALLFAQPLPVKLRTASVSVQPSLRTPPLRACNPKRKRTSPLVIRPRATVQLSTGGKPDSPPPRAENEDDEKQRDKSYALREFTKVASGAFLIGVVLLFYDFLVSLIALSIGLIYAIAVLFEVRGADTLLNRCAASVTRLCTTTAKGLREGWRALRRGVRKGLED
ncbi:hypothetical protein BWQ96_00028 [Gracilariopsis chorda]|uniref:Uncharacterized protein n=1 Tax=Gracilariopsis chorda TaxID=448386 RepID=A0A2V3J615_9FLOR|nr:hypothetical protein BWQ96_00028 [Gracilariopsis chorda]|eukprot:PXF49868.1 hypothetical protein BWQ96_00028 [Gracilariopsis chorda]